LAGNQFNDRVVDFFDPVIALLVEAVDRTLHPSNLGVADVGTASDILFVPQLEVKAVLRANGALKVCIRIVDIFFVPSRNSAGLQLENFVQIDRLRHPEHPWLGVLDVGIVSKIGSSAHAGFKLAAAPIAVIVCSFGFFCDTVTQVPERFHPCYIDGFILDWHSANHAILLEFDDYRPFTFCLERRMKLKSNDSFSIVLVVFAVGAFLPTSATAFQQTTKLAPATSAVPIPADASFNSAETAPSPLSGLDAKLEPSKYFSSVIPVLRFVTYEVDLHQTLLAYSADNECSMNEAFLKLEKQLGMSSLDKVQKQSPDGENSGQKAFYEPIGNDVYAISATQGFFNALHFELSDFRYGDKRVAVEVRFLEVPQSDVAMLQSFMIPGTFEVFGNRLPVVESFGSSTFVRATEASTKAYPTFIGHVDEAGMQQLVKLSKSRSAMTITRVPTVTTLPGQRATVSDFSLRPFVVSVNKVADGTDTAHQPVIQLLEDGMKIAFQTDLQTGKLKLSGVLAFSKVLGVETFDYPSAQTDDSSGVTIQVPEHRIRKVHWSEEVADNRSILIDAVETYELEVKAKTRFKPAVTKTMRRLVLITPRLFEQKEVLADQVEPTNLNR